MRKNKSKKCLTENGNYKKYSFEFGENNIGELRKEITLNSDYLDDYVNSYGISVDSCKMFFRGYIDYLCELSDECNKVLKDNNYNGGDNNRYLYTDGDDFDNKDNLLCGLYMFCDDINDILIYDVDNKNEMRLNGFTDFMVGVKDEK